MSDDDERYEEILEQLEDFSAMLEERFELFEERQDSLERLHANLMMAYTELSSTLETVVQEMMAPRSEDQREAFRKQLRERHTETLEMIRDVSAQAAEADPSDHISSAFSQVADDKHRDH